MAFLVKHPANRKLTGLSARLAATLVAASLFACDTTEPGGKVGMETQAESDAAVEPVKDSRSDLKRSGPHGGGHDPHANLTPEKHAQVALQHLEEGRPALAMETLDMAIEGYPDSAALRGVRGSLLLQEGRSAAALADLNKAVELDPHNPMVLTNRAQAYRNFDRIDEAMADLDSAIELDSGFMAARFNRGSLAFEAGKYARALADFDACVAADPESAAPYFNRASVHDAMGNRELAIADLKRFLEIAPSEEWKDTARGLLQQWEAPGEAAEGSNSS